MQTYKNFVNKMCESRLQTNKNNFDKLKKYKVVIQKSEKKYAKNATIKINQNNKLKKV